MSEFYYLQNNDALQGKIFFDKSLENLTWLKVGKSKMLIHTKK